jgi:hypothetical protein
MNGMKLIEGFANMHSCGRAVRQAREKAGARRPV